MKQFDSETQRYLDGEGPPPADAQTRADAERFEQILARYADDLEPPGEELDRAVMAAIGARSASPTRPRGVRWLLEPIQLRLSPLLAAAALVGIVAVTAVIAMQVTSNSGSVGVAEGAQPPTVLSAVGASAPDAQRVTLAGSFNDWDDAALSFVRHQQTGVWTVTVPLVPGEYEYLFVVDGERWLPDPNAHAQVDDGFGQTNSLLVVGPRGVIRS